MRSGCACMPFRGATVTMVDGIVCLVCWLSSPSGDCAINHGGPVGNGREHANRRHYSNRISAVIAS
jgi:hypothetical protein